MPAIGVEIKGMTELLAKLESLGPRTRTKVEFAVNATTIEALQVARSLSAVRTGYFKSRWQTRAIGGTAFIIRNELFNDAPYASFLIYGTRKMRPRDCLTPAILYGRKRLRMRLAHIKVVD